MQELLDKRDSVDGLDQHAHVLDECGVAIEDPAIVNQYPHRNRPLFTRTGSSGLTGVLYQPDRKYHSETFRIG